MHVCVYIFFGAIDACAPIAATRIHTHNGRMPCDVSEWVSECGCVCLCAERGDIFTTIMCSPACQTNSDRGWECWTIGVSVACGFPCGHHANGMSSCIRCPATVSCRTRSGSSGISSTSASHQQQRQWLTTTMVVRQQQQHSRAHSHCTHVHEKKQRNAIISLLHI